jgi:hypothetical protein
MGHVVRPTVGRVLGEDGWADKAVTARNLVVGGKARRRRVGPPVGSKKPAVPCRIIEIAAGKCGFAGQPSDVSDASDLVQIGNAISVLT